MNRLKELRKEKGLSQQALANELGVHYRTLQNWENGESQIKPEKAEKLANFFGVSIAHLLGYEDNDFKNETDIKVSVLDEALEKLRTINNMLSVENDEEPNMWAIGFRTAIVAIENFKKEIEFGGEQ